MKLGFLYAGQGSQHPGMGQDLYETYPAFREVLDRAETDFDLKALCFQGPENQLNQTRSPSPVWWAFGRRADGGAEGDGHCAGFGGRSVFGGVFRPGGSRRIGDTDGHFSGRLPGEGHGGSRRRP